MFKAKDRVSHPGHGACEVKEICEREISGTTRSYYQLAPMVETGATVYVPVDSAEKVGLRSLINETEADALLASLRNTSVSWVQDAATKQKRFKSLFEQNGVQNLFETMKALCAIVRHQNEKTLGNADKEMLRTLQTKALSEIALAKGITMQAAIQQAEDIILHRTAAPPA